MEVGGGRVLQGRRDCIRRNVEETEDKGERERARRNNVCFFLSFKRLTNDNT